jgi:cation diffusion facilitator CzcD-associated flavoprotein CzcO
MVKDKLPAHRYAHTSEMIDYAALAGKRVAVLGGGASAFDNAQHALGLGADQVHVFIRRSELPTVNPIRFMESSGLIPRFPALSDAAKYRMMASFFERNQPPTNDTFERAAQWPGFRLHLGAPWLDVAETTEGVVVTTPRGTETFDFLVLSTGLVTDPALRPELQDVASDILRWSDRYAPHQGLRTLCSMLILILGMPLSCNRPHPRAATSSMGSLRSTIPASSVSACLLRRFRA